MTAMDTRNPPTTRKASARLGPVPGDPYPWPHDELHPCRPRRAALRRPAGRFCGPGGYVDGVGYELARTRAGLPGTGRMLAHAPDAGMLGVQTREGNARGHECVILCDCTGALRMVTMQGGVFGAVATSHAVHAATTWSDR